VKGVGREEDINICLAFFLIIAVGGGEMKIFILHFYMMSILDFELVDMSIYSLSFLLSWTARGRQTEGKQFSLFTSQRHNSQKYIFN
tara:strand:- start:201 stop:461 length:261 start_codon:yes stop_codon:yes gene_type:complete